MFEAFCTLIATLCLWVAADRLTEIRNELRIMNANHKKGEPTR